MMKTKKWIALIALVAVIAGMVGVIVCLVPGQTDSGKALAKYVAAINKGDTKAMKAMDFRSVMAQAFSAQLSGSELEGLEDMFDNDSDELVSNDKIYKTLAASNLSIANRLPEDFKQIESVKIVGSTDGEAESYMGITGMNVALVLELTYVDAEGKTQTVTQMEDVAVILYNRDYYVAA